MIKIFVFPPTLPTLILNAYPKVSQSDIALIFFYLLARKPNLEEKKSIYSNKFFHNFHLYESSFTCPRLRVGGLA